MALLLHPLVKILPVLNFYSRIALVQSVFQWKDELSEQINCEKFCESFVVQPDLFLCLRPGKEKMVKQKLQQAGIQFAILSDSCLTLSNASKIDDVIDGRRRSSSICKRKLPFATKAGGSFKSFDKKADSMFVALFENKTGS